LQKGFFDLDAFCHHNGAKGMRNTQDVIITELRKKNFASIEKNCC
jgi:hypothetical protein